MRRWFLLGAFSLIFLAGTPWADEGVKLPTSEPIEAPAVKVAPLAPAGLRAERFCTETLLVYDKDGKPETMMFLDKNGVVFATVKVK